MPMIFDARSVAPQQGFPSHPHGKFRAMIINTSREVSNKDPQAGMFRVEFQTDVGRAVKNYNLWNASQDAVRIAYGELSALCHATGIFQIDLEQDGAALRNAQCMIEVMPQAKDPKYTEIRVYDLAGNEPGKAPQGSIMQPAAPAAPQPVYQPQQQQPFNPSANAPPGSFPPPGGAAPGPSFVQPQPTFAPPNPPAQPQFQQQQPMPGQQQQQPYQPPQQQQAYAPPVAPAPGGGAPWNR